MKFNASYLFLPLMAAAVFSFCTKESPVAATAKTGAPDQAAISRTACTFDITVNSGSVNICGTNQTFSQCGKDYLGQWLYGSTTLTAPNSGTFTANSPSSIYITVNGTGTANVTVKTDGGEVSTTVGNSFGDHEIYFDDVTCEPHVL